MIWRWLLTLAPVLVSLVIGLWLNSSPKYNPVVYVRADLGTTFIIFGSLLSLIAMTFMAFWELWQWAKKTQLDAIIHAAEDRRRFLQRLDHELKNPLTAILAGLANLTSAEQVSVKQETLDSVETQVKRLSRLVSELRKLSDLETRELEFSPINLSDLLQEAFDLSLDQSDASDRRMNISLPRAPWPLPPVLGDRDLLFLAIHNLLSNAMKFSRPGDMIELRAFEDSSYDVIEVADTGPGIPDEEAPHVWEELYRGIGARGIPGSGLGLALVKAIVTRHNGHVTLRSRPGQGTVFTLRIPVAPAIRK